MDKIAVISDIHSNLIALNEVLNDIREREADTIICLGDIVGKGPKPKEVLDIIRESCQYVVKGNVDEFCAGNKANTLLRKWTQERLDRSSRDYIMNLPIAVEFYMSGSYIRLFHASPQGVHNKVYPYDSIEKRLSLFENTEHTTDIEPDIVGYGEVHTSFVQRLCNKTIFNPGSVGNPLELNLKEGVGSSIETTQASYAIMEGCYGCQETKPFSIQLIRVPYDIELAVQQAREERIPQLKEYIIELRKGIYRGAQR